MILDTQYYLLLWKSTQLRVAELMLWFFVSVEQTNNRSTKCVAKSFYGIEVFSVEIGCG